MLLKPVASVTQANEILSSCNTSLSVWPDMVRMQLYVHIIGRSLSTDHAPIFISFEHFHSEFR